MIRGNRVAVVAAAFAAALSFGALAATAGTAQAAPVHVHGIQGTGHNAITNGIQGSGHNAITNGIQGSGARPGGISGGGQA